MSAARTAHTGRSTRTAALTATLLALAAAALLPGARPAAAAGTDAGGTVLGTCGAGQLCLWGNSDFTGERLTFELAGTDIESCEVLPARYTANAYANRTGRPVTLYQSAECATTGEFHTHPSGSWTPKSAYQVRAFKIWER